nr:haloacid dehalogenase-like hydrolase family protein [Tanacetum cinerariifolium]
MKVFEDQETSINRTCFEDFSQGLLGIKPLAIFLRSSVDIAELLRLNVSMAMKLGFDGIKDTDFKTRDPAVDDVGQYESVELSIHLCNDEFIRELNKDWRNEDHATDVLFMSHHVPELRLLMITTLDI